jgi:DNA-binding MarR family transcriptional regulator
LARKPFGIPVAPNIGEHSDEPGFLIRRLNQIGISLFLDRLADFNITPLQSTIISIADRYPGLTQKAIAAKAMLDASTTHDIILRLEAKGLLTRKKDPGDQRSRVIELTAIGVKALRTIEPVLRATQKELVSSLSSQDRATLVRLLSTLIEAHLDRQEIRDTSSPWRRSIHPPKGDL